MFLDRNGVRIATLKQTEKVILLTVHFLYRDVHRSMSRFTRLTVIFMNIHYLYIASTVYFMYYFELCIFLLTNTVLFLYVSNYTLSVHVSTVHFLYFPELYISCTWF